MSSLIIIDPQLGPYGLGSLAELLAGATADSAATVHSILAMAQAIEVADRLQRTRDLLPGNVATRGAGCNVAAYLLAMNEVRRVLLIDPVPTFTRDWGFNKASRTDTHFVERIVAAAEAEPDLEAIKVWSDPEVDEGRLPDSAYGLMASEMSRRPEVRERLEQALRATEVPRQPYDDQRLRPSLKAEEELDWLANVRGVEPASVTIWLSHDARGNAPQAQQGYLLNALPGVSVVVQPWEHYDFLVDPKPVAAALHDWLHDPPPS